MRVCTIPADFERDVAAARTEALAAMLADAIQRAPGFGPLFDKWTPGHVMVRNGQDIWDDLWLLTILHHYDGDYLRFLPEYTDDELLAASALVATQRQLAAL